MPDFNFKPQGPIKIDKNTFKVIDMAGKSAITDVARAYVEADVAVQPGSATFAVLQQEGVFARVGVNVPEGGGFWLLLKKVNGIWVTLLGGQDLPGKAIGQKYGLPSGWYSKEY